MFTSYFVAFRREIKSKVLLMANTQNMCLNTYWRGMGGNILINRAYA